MYFINKLCCICLCKKSDLKSMFDVDNDGISHYKKFLSTLAESDFDEIEEHMRLICEECIVTLNMVYAFKEKYLRNKTIFMSYISKLQTFSKIRGILSVRLIDIKKGIKTEKPTIEIKREKEDMDVDSVNETLQSTSAEDFLSVPIKEEFMDHGDDHLTEEIDVKEETTQVYIKQEPTESQPVTEETLHFEEHFMDIPFVNCSTEIEPLVEVKNEPISDTEAPPDGSTSQESWINNVKEDRLNDQPSDGTENHSSEKPYICKICGKSFKYNWTCVRHMQIHAGVKPFACKLCGRKFSQTGTLTKHMLIHSDPLSEVKNEPMSDEVPQDGNTSQAVGINIVKQEIINDQPSDEMETHSAKKPHKCNICGKTFKHKWTCVRHMRIHTGERPYTCNICNKNFRESCILAKHLLVHSDERPYECHICNKRYRESGSLAKHLPIHSDERPYACDVCNKSFPIKSMLKSHSRIHTENLFECDVCKKQFNLQSNLTKHMRIHTGEKPFECDVCKKKFREAGTLAKHKLRHTGGRPYGCKICGKKFIQSVSLTKHMQLHSS